MAGLAVILCRSLRQSCLALLWPCWRLCSWSVSPFVRCAVPALHRFSSTSFAVSEIVKVLFQNGISARPVPLSSCPPGCPAASTAVFSPSSAMSTISIHGRCPVACSSDADLKAHDAGLAAHACSRGRFPSCAPYGHQGKPCCCAGLRYFGRACWCGRHSLGGAARLRRPINGQPLRC